MALLARDIRARPAHIDAEVTAVNPAEAGEPLPEYLNPRLPLRIGLGILHQHADPPPAAVLLRARRERPRRRTAEQGDELAPLHDRPPLRRALNLLHGQLGTATACRREFIARSRPL